MTALQLDPSAHAPWTRTIFGLVAIALLPFRRGLGESHFVLSLVRVSLSVPDPVWERRFRNCDYLSTARLSASAANSLRAASAMSDPVFACPLIPHPPSGDSVISTQVRSARWDRRRRRQRCRSVPGQPQAASRGPRHQPASVPELACSCCHHRHWIANRREGRGQRPQCSS